MIILAVFLIACLVARWASNKQTRIYSDQDLMERYIVWSHRKYRRSLNKQPLF